MTEQPRAPGVERFLNLFTEVRPGEARTALLLALNVFLILMAYYILKTVREALILSEGSAELKSYLSAGQVVVLAFVVPLYGRLVARFPRMRLINIVTMFFVACPLAFYLLAQFHVPLGSIYFVWIGIFSLMIVTQFWSFANDVYAKEEGERLLVLVGLGASLGAVAGARVADRLIEPFGVLQLMLLGSGVLGLQLLLTNYIDRKERVRRPQIAHARKVDAAPVANPFAMVLRTRYLLLMALMILVINWVNATGEYILGSLIFVPFLNAALAAKVVENSTDYSLNNTVRSMLFLPCTYEQKFAAKQAIDSFVVRMGDVLSAALVFVGTTFVALPARGFAAVNVALAVVALLLAWRVGRHYKALTATHPVPAAA